MPFKIISTTKGNKLELSIVPSKWENKGKVRWPRYNVEALSRDGNGIPGPNWLTFNCTVKRQYFKTYAEADAELTNMLFETDTTDTDVPVSETVIQNLSAGPDFNSLAQTMVGMHLYLSIFKP